ncbi:MAG: fasciclin domain-containing protein [Saprospiraceae bacterium]|nr:fasciclin domain-containing protein [Saprospiraceae bacterium]
MYPQKNRFILLLLVILTSHCATTTFTPLEGLWPTLSNTENTSQFNALVTLSGGLSLVLQEPKNHTLLVPVDSVFQELPPKVMEDLMNPTNNNLRTNVLRAHVIPGSYPYKRLTKTKLVQSAMKKDLQVELRGSDIFITDAKVLQTLRTNQGYIHLIDKVLKN